MFVEIKELKSEVEMDRFLKRGRNNNNNKLPPEVAMEALKNTNHYTNIKFIIKEINGLSDDEKLEFKEFVLSAICEREHTPQNLKDLRKLAVDGGYVEEFDKVLDDNKTAISYPCDNFLMIGKISKYIAHKYGDFAAEDYNTFEEGVDLSKYKTVMIVYPDRRIENMGYREEFIFHGKDVKLPKRIILRNIDEVKFCDSVDMANVKEIVCDNGLDIFNVENLSSDIVISYDTSLHIGQVDLTGFDGIRIRDDSNVYFTDVSGFPSNFDISKCHKARFRKCDLSKMPEQNLENVKCLRVFECDIPSWINVSHCTEVIFSGCDFRDVEKLELPIGGSLEMVCCKNLPKVLDFSRCDGVEIVNTDFSGVEKLIFKDKEQMFGFDLDESFMGDIVYNNKPWWYNRLWGAKGIN